MKKKKLTELSILIAEAEKFAESESIFNNSALYGVTDGKAVGTYLEHKFKEQLEKTYEVGGSSANGLDIPAAEVDIKVTSIKQPQSSCPFKSASQKIYGLGYNLLLFVYEKKDDPKTKTARLNILQPEQGYLTISNALQWRLQYARVVEVAGQVSGINLIRGGGQ